VLSGGGAKRKMLGSDLRGGVVNPMINTRNTNKTGRNDKYVSLCLKDRSFR
jgi:hypothetical protein